MPRPAGTWVDLFLQVLSSSELLQTLSLARKICAKVQLPERATWLRSTLAPPSQMLISPARGRRPCDRFSPWPVVPRQPWVPEREFELYQDVVANVYRHHDAMLGRYVELAGPDAHVILLSDHGFHADEQRLAWIPAEPAGPADEHRILGSS